MKTVSVTGGAGFIGSHLCEALLRKGYTVKVLDNLSLGNVDWIPEDERLEFIEGDILDKDACRKVCQGSSGVFHLAAMSKVAPSLDSQEMLAYCMEQNVVGTAHMLEAASSAGVGKFIYAASSTVYGNNPVPHCETMPPDCMTPYALSKYAGELTALLHSSLYELPVVALRYFQVYGPRQPASGPYSVVAGIFLEQLRNGEPLTIHGDGTQSRDFVHVDDVVEANIRAFESKARGVALNVGTGVSFTIKDLADLISDNQRSHLPRRKADLEATCADTGALVRHLGWKPEIEFGTAIKALVKEVLKT